LAGATTYCLDGQVYSAGSAVSWLEQLELVSGAAQLDEIGAAETEALFVPSLAGLGAPFWAPDARGGWLGLSLATRRDDLVRAVIWGIAAQVASLAKAMEGDIGRPLERLRVDGGLTRSAALMQAQADLLQAPVELYPSADATALGVGALARARPIPHSSTPVSMQSRARSRRGSSAAATIFSASTRPAPAFRWSEPALYSSPGARSSSALSPASSRGRTRMAIRRSAGSR